MIIKTKGETAILTVTILWTIWLVIKSIDTECFSLIDTYMTIILLYIQLFTNRLINSKR